jgi:galactoside O-acetyltransferase
MVSIKGKIYEQAKVINIQNLELGIFSQIDDFCFINSGIKCKIGRNVHIASFTTIVGGGECHIGDFSGLSAGCRLITATDDFTGPYLTNPTVPGEYTNVTKGAIRIGKHAIIGTNTVIFPNVTIGDGCAVGAGAVIRKDLEAWTVYAMSNGKLKALKKRPQEEILIKEQEYLDSQNA